MITRITLNNFMAHHHTVLELGPGVTVLTGPNNTGKSAIVEALRCVVTNPTPKHYIRHGAKKASVEVEIEDGTKVTWIRNKASAGYEIHYPDRDKPEEFWKLGRSGVPDEVRKVLRLDEVELETGQSIDVHIGNQREPVFLLNEPASAVAAFFAASTEGSHLLAMQDKLKNRTRDAKRQEAGLLKTQDRIAAELDGLAGLPDVTLLMQQASQLEAENQRLEQQNHLLAEMLEKENFIQNNLESQKNIAATLAVVEEPPALYDTRTVRDLLQTLSNVSSQLSGATEASRQLSPLSGPPEIAPTKPLGTCIRQLQTIEEDMQRQRSESEALSPLAPAPDLQETTSLGAMILQSRKIVSQMDNQSSIIGQLSNMPEPPGLSPCTPLQSLADSVQRCNADMNALTARLEAETEEISRLEEHIKGRLEAIGSCPLCGNDMDMNHFMGEEYES